MLALFKRCFRAKFCESFSVSVGWFGFAGDATSVTFRALCFGGLSLLESSASSCFDGLIAGRRIYYLLGSESPSLCSFD